MNTRSKFFIPLIVLLVCVLTACGPRKKFVAPEIEPPAELIPGYVPEGFKLISGFQLEGEVTWQVTSKDDETGRVKSLGRRFLAFDLKSPEGNDIQGVYYQSRDQILLISKSYFPEGNLDLWKTAFEASRFKPCECECIALRLDAIPLPPRLAEIQEERTIDGTRVVVLKGLLGWITVFVRGDYLLTVESGISLEENLKVVASLLNK